MEGQLDKILNYFSFLDDDQKEKLTQIGDLYTEWNSKINVISRKDIDQLYIRHVLHSLTIAKYTRFKPGTKILDLGTGGGFPGIPLAIIYPKVEFHLIDGTAKKIKVVQEVISALKLENVTTKQDRAEEHKIKYDFVVSRAVAQLEKLWMWSRPLIHTNQKNALPNGLICLKGGDLGEEIKAMPRKSYVEKIPISKFFEESAFEEKYVVYVQR